MEFAIIFNLLASVQSPVRPRWAVGEVANRNEEHYTPVTGAGEYASLSPGLNLD
jgi:hypothetical protein